MRKVEITWAEFKRLTEDAGIKNSDKIGWIDFSSGKADSVKVVKNESDDLVRITEQYDRWSLHDSPNTSFMLNPESPQAKGLVNFRDGVKPDA